MHSFLHHSQENAGPPQVFLSTSQLASCSDSAPSKLPQGSLEPRASSPAGGGSASRPWGRSQANAGHWKRLALGLLAASTLLTAPLAMAETPWQAAHPARAEVLQRANHLDQRIAYERWTGALTPWRAAALQHQVAQVRWRQNMLARRQGGALVRSQYWALNRQEDAISREIAP